MKQDQARRIVLACIAHLTRRLPVGAGAAREVLGWVEEDHARALDLALSPQRSDQDEEDGDDPWTPPRRHRRRGRRVVRGAARPDYSPRLWKELGQVVEARLGRLRRGRPTAFDRNLALLGDHVGLNELDRRILALLLLESAGWFEFGVLMDLLRGVARAQDHTDILAHLLDERPARLQARLGRHAPLVAKGLVHWWTERGCDTAGWRVTRWLGHALAPPNRTLADILHSLAGRQVTGECEWEDFEHLGADGAFVRDLLRGALKGKRQGVNILLYGPTGTGKSAFAATLARTLGVALHAVGESQSEEEMTRADRLANLDTTQQLLAGGRDMLLLFDEMEDLLQLPDPEQGPGRRHARGSKAWLTRMLERNTVPVIWTTNAVEALDPAFLRRMSFPLEVRAPAPAQRARIWRRVLARERMRLPEAEIEALAREFDAAPGLALGAVRAARMARGGAPALRRAVRAIRKAMEGGRDRPPEVRPPAAALPELVRADMDLERLAASLVGRTGPVSFCLSGPPGTGKSLWLRCLAERLGLPVLQKRTSDLVSMWVGESEKNIAAAFAEARAQGALLVLDEADSLLRNREGAQHSWEVTQVNEMLTWMEAHDGIFGCTTNLVEGLDPASLRRFTFKVRLDYLDAGQVALAFRHFFGQEPPAELARLDRLTPGDFATVARIARVTGESAPHQLAAMLAREQQAKPGARHPVGFLAG